MKSLRVLAVLAALSNIIQPAAADEVDYCTVTYAGQLLDVRVYEFIYEIEDLCQEDQRLMVQIMSGGGNEQAGFTLYNFLRRWPGGVDTYAIGQVASSAVPVFMAGDERLIDWSSLVLIHPSSGTEYINYDIGLLSENLSILSFNDRIYLGIIAERADISIEEIALLNQMREAMGAERAVELGLATAVIH